VIAITNYGAGNLTSVQKAFACFRSDCVVTSNADEVARADKIIVPGVGHFATTQTLFNNGMAHAIRESLGRGRPLLGICLGLQWMFQGSLEAKGVPGLELFSGLCSRFPNNVKSPHVGWNQVEVKNGSRLFNSIPSGSYFYFTHSYRAPLTEATTAACHYGTPFTAAVESGNVFGVQFHPEKSGAAGLKVLENFCAL
jgi:imidazole glycerol-phosphate synthase subunit HisH